HEALERAAHHFERDEYWPGMLWLIRGLETAPADEHELQESFRRLLATWSRQVYPVKAVIRPSLHCLSPDRKVLAVRNQDTTTVQLWDVSTGRPLGEPLRHPQEVGHMVFRAEGKTLLTQCSDKDTITADCTARHWDVATGRLVGEPRALP